MLNIPTLTGNVQAKKLICKSTLYIHYSKLKIILLSRARLMCENKLCATDTRISCDE